MVGLIVGPTEKREKRSKKQMIQNPIICPVCGSSAVETETKATKHVFNGAGTFNVDEIVNRCSTCGEEGDFAGVNDVRINDALEIFRKKFLSDLIQNLAARNITMAWIERCLAIPQRTLHRWKKGKCTASDLALLRIIDTFPWILEVAKQGFSQKAANPTYPVTPYPHNSIYPFG